MSNDRRLRVWELTRAGVRRIVGTMKTKSSEKAVRVLAVASGGGHWVQLRRLAPAWEGCDVAYMTTEAGYREHVAPARFYVVRDANRWDKIGLLRQVLGVAWVLVRERPKAIVTTGAAPGFFALGLGRLLGARTIWVDSIANAEELSGSGAKAGRFARLWLTQWPHLARPEGPGCEGSVLG